MILSDAIVLVGGLVLLADAIVVRPVPQVVLAESIVLTGEPE